MVDETTPIMKTEDPLLSQFTRLNSRISLYTPSVRTSSLQNHVDPTIILFYAWTDASPKHYTKYLQKYTSLFPHARIVLTTITMSEFLSPNEATRKATMKPVLALLTSKTESASPKERILVHGFSNGACKRIWSLETVYREKTGLPFPAQLEVFDSCPGVAGRWARDYHVFTRILPRNPIVAFLTKIFLASLTTCLWIIFNLTPFWRSFYFIPRRDMNDFKFVSKDVRRLYIYSKEDTVIHYRDIESHADDFAAKGAVVEKVCVEGTGHVAHAKGERWDEYWEMVVGAWGRSVKSVSN